MLTHRELAGLWMHYRNHVGRTPTGTAGGIQVLVVSACNGRPIADAAIVIEYRELAICRLARTAARGQARAEGLTTGGTYTIA